MGDRLARALPVAAPALLTVFLAFRGGGFFPDTQALVALGLLLGLVLRVTLVPRPFEGISAPLVAAAGLLALFSAWTLISSAWSDASGRALLEHHRVLLYVLGMAVFGSFARTDGTLAWAVRLLGLAIAVVAAAALATRVFPDAFPVDPNVADNRLSWPITYWNALAVLVAMGTVLAVHVSADLREPRAARVVAAGLLPILATTLYLTFSRGGIASGLVGVVVYVLVARPAGVASALLAALPAIVAVRVAYGADAIATTDYDSQQAVAEGQDIALAVGLCVLGAVALRALALAADARIARALEGRRPWSRGALAAAYGGGFAVFVAVALAVGAPGFVERQYDRFVAVDTTTEADQRERLLNPGNNGRLEEWRVARDMWRTDRLKGTGAGTYQVQWTQRRDVYLDVVDGHSLYIEVLGELGIVGLALLVAAIGLVLWGFARLARGPGRGPPAALLAAGTTWALHAGLDWDWELPALTFWFFALGGMALAAPAGRPRRGTLLDDLGRPWRVGLALGCLVLAVTPWLVLRSQTELRAAVGALRAGECDAAIEHALASAEALSVRADPWEVVGYCDVRLGQPDLAERAMRRAIARDPLNWEFHYGLALVRGAFGRDPRPAAKRAWQLNRKEELAVAGYEQLDGRDPDVWSVRARALPLPGY